MNWEKIELLVKEQTQVMMELSMEIMQLQSTPEVFDDIIEPLKDGTIDDGDFEAVSSGLLTMTKELGSYKKLLDFTKDNRESFGNMYKFLGNESAGNYDQFVEMTQKIAADLGAAAIFNQFETMGLVSDNRSS